MRARDVRPPSSPTTRATEVADALGVALEQDQLVLVGAVRGQHVGGPNPRRDQLADRFGRRARRDVQAHHGEHAPGRSTPCRTPPPAALRNRRASAAGGRAPSDAAAGPSASPTRSRSPRRAAPARAARAAAGCRAGASRWCCPCPRSQMVAHVQARVVARGVRLVDAHVVVLVAPDGTCPRLRQRVHREEVRTHHDQVEDAVLDGARVHLAHRWRAGCGRLW